MIHSFSLADTRLVSELQSQGSYLDLRRALLWPRNSVSAAMSIYWPLSRRSVRTLVFQDNSNGTRVSGFVQYCERVERHEADIIFCAPALGTNSADPHSRGLWQKLMTNLIVRLGERGIQRVYARIPDGAPELDLFWQLGFSAYARERIYHRTTTPATSDAPGRVYWRPQHALDAWNAGQLYSAVTPKLVQQAENLPQSDPETPFRDGFGRRVDRRYIWSENDELCGILRLIEGTQACWLKLIVDPTCLDRADALMRDAMRLVPPIRDAAQRLYASVREYQSELEGAVVRAGFAWLATEMLMVKHTTVMVKKPILTPLSAIEGIDARPTSSATHIVGARPCRGMLSADCRQAKPTVRP
ncbi:MAG: hypothetical protein HY259_15445 [Chloroflexi bacterium]|nr:hypothetical protein [Chloroflexota bacterium]